MPAFTPPTIPDALRGDISGISAADRLFSYYPPQEMGVTVYKDYQGNWQQEPYPYQGGSQSRTFDSGVLVEDSTDHGLADAQVVFMGGHTYPIDQTVADELIAAGFVVGGHLDIREQKFIDFAIASTPNLGWKGGDGFASQPIAGGSVVLSNFADNNIGTLDANNYFSAVAVARNALLLSNPAGDVTGQNLPGGAHPAFVNATPGNWYWPLDMFLDGTGSDGIANVMVSALELGPGAGFGALIGNTILTLTLFGTVGSEITVTPWGTVNQISTVTNDDDFHYFIGSTGHPTDIFNPYVIISRAPLGQALNMAEHRQWDGENWVVANTFAPLVDTKGNKINGAITIAKAGTRWVLARLRNFQQENVELYVSDNPQGPYEFYFQGGYPKPPQGLATDPVTKGMPPKGHYFVYYQPKFHEYLAPNSKHLVLSYNRNIFGQAFPFAGIPFQQTIRVHASFNCPQLIYLPAPEA